MLIHIIKKELLNNLLTARVLICYGIIFLLLSASMVIRSVQYRSSLDAAVKYQAQAEEAFEKGLEQEYDYMLWRRHVQIMPVPSSVFCRGFESQIAEPFRLSVSVMFNFFDEMIRDVPVFRIFRVFDGALIIGLIVSLLAVFICYDSIAGEAETGTLRLMLAGGVPRVLIITGKCVGALLSVVLPVLSALAFSLVWMVVVAGISLTPGDYARFAMQGGLVVLLSAQAVFITMLCSAVCRKPGTALLTALLVWIGTGLVVPQLSIEAGKHISPLRRFGRVLGDYVDKDNVELENRTAPVRVMRRQVRHGRMDPEKMEWEERELFWKYFEIMYTYQRVKVRERMAELAGQVNMSVVLARISPVGAYLLAAADLAGTGIDDFLKAQDWKMDLTLENRRVHVQEYMRRVDLYRNLTVRELDSRVNKKHAFDIGKLPSLIYTRPGPVSSLVQALPEITVMLLQAALLFMLTFYFFIKRDI